MKQGKEQSIHLYWIAILLISLFVITSANEESSINDNSNVRPGCDIGPGSLDKYGGTRTCIESPTNFDGRRCFFTIIPDCAGPNSPLVFDSHGLASCPSKTAELTRWKEMAQEHCFVLVYPLGMTDAEVADLTCWGLPGGALDEESGEEAYSCCCTRRIRPVVTQDAALFRQIAAVVIRDVPIQTSNTVTIDTKRIYMAGHSNGCMAAMSIAAQSSDWVAAVGCHSGSAITAFPESYNATPMALVHGTKDRVVAYDGSFLFFSAETTHKVLSIANECTAFQENRIEEFWGSNNTVTEFASTGCKNNATVMLYAVEGAGHAPYLDAETYRRDEIPTRFDSTKLMWYFVKEYSVDITPTLEVEITGHYPSLPSIPDDPIVFADENQEDKAVDTASSSSSRISLVWLTAASIVPMIGTYYDIMIT